MNSIVTLDLEHLGQPNVIASYLVPAPEGGFVLLESGPGSTVPVLERKVEAAGFHLEELLAVFVTHVHLDHAGAAGELARRTGALVAVHPAGAPHMADPSRLLASAGRLYGDLMDTLWGTMEPVPEDLLVAVEDGQVVEVGGLGVRALHTPGHARHHVAWAVGGAIATGDVGGIRIPGWSHVVPPTPPPDIDVPTWLKSLDRLRGEAPERLLLTHFGAYDDPGEHLARLEEVLVLWDEQASKAVAAGEGVEGLTRRLERLDRARLQALGAGEEATAAYRRACPMEMNAAGLLRAVTRVPRA